MSNCSALQLSTTTESLCCGTRSVDRNVPPKMRVIGESVALACDPRLEFSDAEKGDPYRPCYYCPILTPNLHPSIFLRWLFFALLSAINGLGVRLWRNRGEERQEFVLKRVKVKSQELFGVFLVSALRYELS
jgi:hypothetical protein